MNASCKDGTIISELMDVFTDPDPKNTRFPKTEQRIQKMKHDLEEVDHMCQLVEEYADKKAAKVAKKAAIIATVEALRECNVSAFDISKRIQSKYGLSAKAAKRYANS